jgi:hypothetical protein
MSSEFWSILKASGGDPNRLKNVLQSKPAEEVAAFGKEFYQGLIDLNRWNLWGAGYVMAGEMSDDGFHYFRSWILGKGQEAYEIARNSPDNLGQFATPNDEFGNELLEYVAIEILESRGISDPREDFDVTPDDEATGESWEEEDLPTLFPKLTAQFGE